MESIVIFFMREEFWFDYWFQKLSNITISLSFKHINKGTQGELLCWLCNGSFNQETQVQVNSQTTKNEKTMERHLSNIMNTYTDSQQQILYNVSKKECFPKIYDSPSLSRHSQFCLTRSINKMHLIRLLCDIQISEKGQRHSEYRRIFKPLSILKIINHFKVKNVKKLSHISCVTPYRVLVSDLHSLLLTYKSGDCLHELTKITIQILR